eukprot:CAMPEP_0168195824 /NCGR_PEP_ID=MMETSP0139_2-20121125/20112_1 /TAXON_ID=44445 /ORGANISM="Pseudo-nitzschia australis, Strain 10249 10 AB" /LENGTH=134 /DNA_ID=CAMNT_0008119805 /DNA_START=33 /DNA_END=435 /DNA_ORIENTATION=-
MNTQLTNTTKGSHAYAVDALTATVDQLWTEIDMNQQNVNTIVSTQNQMLAQPEQAYSTHYVPSVVSATTATTPSGLANSATDQRLDKIKSMFQQFMQQQQNGTNSATVPPTGVTAATTALEDKETPMDHRDNGN